MVRQLPDTVVEPLREDVRAFLKQRPDLTAADFAQYTTLSYTAVKNFVNGYIPGGFEVAGEIRRVLALAKAGDIMQPGGRNAVMLTEDTEKRVRRVRAVGDFYETQTVKRVREVCEYCVENAAIGVVTADFGVGKTEAVKHWKQGAGSKVESIVFEFDEFTRGSKVDFVGSLARLFGSDIPVGSMNGGRLFRAVVEHLAQHPCLLIFDQCETVRPLIFQIVRQIWDRTREYGVGVVLLAAPILAQRMLTARMADLGALTSRVGVWAMLSGITRNEMAAVVRNEGFTEVDEDAFDLWWRTCGGSMRRLMRAIDLLKSKHAGKRITVKTITGISGYLWGMNE